MKKAEISKKLKLKAAASLKSSDDPKTLEEFNAFLTKWANDNREVYMKLQGYVSDDLGREATPEETIHAVLESYLDEHDPRRKMH